MEFVETPGKFNLVADGGGWFRGRPSGQQESIRYIYPGCNLLCHRGHPWIDKAHLLSNMSVCHCNEYDENDYDYNPSSSYVGTNCTDGSSEVNGLFLGKF